MELYQINRILLCVAFLMSREASSEPNVIEGTCDWKVSGQKSVPASVFTVHFTACISGRLEWRNPFGGIEVTFESRVPNPTLGTYQVCLTAKDFGTNIIRRVGNTFEHLRRSNEKNTTSEICIGSDTKKILIYFESTDDLKTELAVFTYRTSFRRKGRGLLRPKECKPCGYHELIKSFCNGHFAVHGYVKEVLPIGGESERGEAVVVVKKILHQSVKIFQSENSHQFIGNVNFPLFCHWKKRSKHGFLFTGNIKDGVGPVVQCRIKFKLWKKVYHKKICDDKVLQT